MSAAKPLHERLRDVAARIARLGDREDVLQAAAEIEGHNEAYAVLVDQKQTLKAELAHTQGNHSHTLDFIARWRELLVALRTEHPDDIRIKRALVGEHPMRPAPWETKP